MNNWYDDLLTKEDVPKSTNWYDQMLEEKPQEPSTTGWYDEISAEPKVAEKKPELGWGETAKKMLKPSPAAETAAHLGWGTTTWIPSKMSGLGQIGLQKITNRVLEDAIKDERISPEKREILRQKGLYSPEKIREMAEQSEALWQILPPPESKEAKYVLEKVGKGLDWALTHFRVADEYYTKKGYPNLGYALRFIGEFLFFRGVHGLGVKSTAKLKKLRKKVVEKAPAAEIKEPLDAVLDEMRIEKEGITPKADTLKGVTKSQKMRAHKIAKEKGFTEAERRDLAEQVTGKRSMMDMNRESAREFIDVLKRGREEIADAGRIREEVREAGEEVRIKGKEERPVRVRDIEEDRLEAREREAKEEVVDLYPPPGTPKFKTGDRVEIVPPEVDGVATQGVTKGIFDKMDSIGPTASVYDWNRTFPKIESYIIESYGEEGFKKINNYKNQILNDYISREKGLTRDDLDATSFIEAWQHYEDLLLGGRLSKPKLELVKEEIVESEVKPEIEEPSLRSDLSEKVRYEGIQDDIVKSPTGELIEEPAYYVYTDLKTESTFMIPLKADLNKAVADRLVEMEKAFKKPEVEPPSKAVETLISDDIRTAEDMGFYADIKDMIGKKRKVGEIMKELKQKAYYEEDLKDFGYTEKDIRESIRAIKAETGDEVAIKQIQSVLKVEKKKVEKITEEERVEPKKEPVPKAEEELITAPKEIDEVRFRWEQEQVPIKNEEGRILKSKVFAMKRMKELGQTGELVKNPKGEGWLLKRERPSVEERRAEEKEWEEVLREEELGEIGEEGLGERVDVDIDHLWGEKGAITFDFESIRKLKDLIKGGLSRDEIVAGLKSRGATDKDINKLFAAVSVRIPIGESKWLKKGQSPLEFLPARTVGKTKEGRVLKAPAVTREDAHIVATTTDLPSDVGVGLKKAPVGEKLRWAPSEGIFTQLGKPLREVFYRRMVKAHKKSSDYAKELLKDARKLNRTFSLGSREIHSERLSIYETAQQPDGVARLKLQDVTKIPKLTPKEKIVYEARQEAYKKLYVGINKARIATGKRAFPPIENYTMWAHDMAKLKDFERISAFDKMEKIQAGLDRIRDIPSQIDKLGRTVSLKGHEKLRAGPDMPGYFILDSAENYNVYAKLAADVIHESEPIAYMHELLTKKFELSKNAPNTHKFLSQWLDFQKGHEPIMFIENPKTRRLMRTASSNVAVAYLTYQLRPAIVQLASLSLSYSKLGERFTAEGAVRLLNPYELIRVAKESNIITTRTPEEILIEAQRVYPFFRGLKGKTIAKGWAKVKRIGSVGLRFTDSVVAYLTYLGAEAKGKALYKKLPKDQRQAISIKDFSRNYADDITVQCQGSAAKSARAPLQRHAEGKLITTLGTFTIANFDFITRHLMGIKNPDITKPQTVASAMRFVLASTIISSIFSEVLQLTSPIPTPVDAFRESLETDPSTRKAFQAAVTELLEFIPIYGGKYKFDSELMGPVVDQLVKLGKGDYSSLGRLGGMPGFQALWKAYRAERQGGTAIDMVMGRYLEPPKSLTAPIGGRKTDLLAPIGED